MIDFAGVGLTAPDGRTRSRLADWWHLHRVREAEPDGYDLQGTQHLPRPGPPVREPPRPGVLRWPTGASRWATLHHLASAAQLARVRAALGTGNGPATLTIDDGTTRVTPSMYLLPPRPVCYEPGASDLYLITLVDERWYWWLAGDQTVSTTPASWSALFTTLFGKLGVTPAVDAIPSGYATPTDRWKLAYQPLPVLLDAAARSVGCRVTRGLDGAVRVRRWAGAKADLDSQFAANARHLAAGGRYAAADIARSVPEKVAVVFFASGGVPESTDARTLASLSLPEFGSATGVAGKAGQFWADLPATAAGQAACATEAAGDFYRWQLPDLDATFRGVVAWPPTGAEEAVEYEAVYPAGADGPHPKALTRVLRPSLSDPNVYGSGRSADVAAPVGFVSPVRVGGRPNGPVPPAGVWVGQGTAFSFTATDADVGWWDVVLTFYGWIRAYEMAGDGLAAGGSYRLLVYTNTQMGGGVAGNLALYGGNVVANGRAVPRVFPSGAFTVPPPPYGANGIAAAYGINEPFESEIDDEGTLTLVGRFQVTHAGPVGLGYSVYVDPVPILGFHVNSLANLYSLDVNVCPSVRLSKTPNASDQQFGVGTGCVAVVATGAYPTGGFAVNRSGSPADLTNNTH